jgi:hypothetical protein
MFGIGHQAVLVKLASGFFCVAEHDSEVFTIIDPQGLRETQACAWRIGEPVRAREGIKLKDCIEAA